MHSCLVFLSLISPACALSAVPELMSKAFLYIVKSMFNQDVDASLGPEFRGKTVSSRFIICMILNYNRR